MRSSRRSTKNHTSSAEASREEGIAWLGVGQKENLTSFRSRLPRQHARGVLCKGNKVPGISMYKHVGMPLNSQ
ncbi:hypothetical protein CEXT_656261 [Caerostris extrusa]|uniref:Uncharacterized protein n=1 Tax=Caerostris extrusa TaxID=172846 RepID=A0AAV4U149_CAEEX|nr:hypothetical protein CEXT_656261 [Caerostris extrusa]